MLKNMAHLSTRRDCSLARVRIVVYTSLPAGLRPFLPNKLIGSSIVVSWIPDELPGGRSAVAAHQFVFLGAFMLRIVVSLWFVDSGQCPGGRKATERASA